MSALVPNRFLFDFSFPLRYRASFPRLDGTLAGWTKQERLPRLAELEGQTEFADVRACWNEGGLALACEVTGKRRTLRCDPARFWEGDNVRLCTDMRDTRTIRRASRFCQQFYFLPTGGGSASSAPVAGVNPIKRAREEAPSVPAERIGIASIVHEAGYSLEVHIPDACLSGFDPSEHARIGFYYIVEDGDLGQQFLTVGDDLGWHVDPSTWATARLVR
jgi:hypothetical protein